MNNGLRRSMMEKDVKIRRLKPGLTARNPVRQAKNDLAAMGMSARQIRKFRKRLGREEAAEARARAAGAAEAARGPTPEGS